MPINHDAVGATSEPTSHSWTSKDCLLYALGVGAGTDELAFTTENTKDTPQQVLPDRGGDPRHGRHRRHGRARRVQPGDARARRAGDRAARPDPRRGLGHLRRRDHRHLGQGQGRRGGARVPLDQRRHRRAAVPQHHELFIRGEGGWGGERGPGSDRNTPPEREPDHAVTYPTREDQALLYRLSGDRNPLHSDPSFAQRAGFDRPILHGLCTYGFTGRALLHTLCGSDPARFRGMEGRFASPVFPGEALTVKMWETGDGTAIFQTCGADGRVVVDGGSCTYTA